MNFVSRLVRLVTGCAHADTYRERRPLHGVDVMHLVCLDCGHVVPAIQRSAEEHREAIVTGAIRFPKARKQVFELARRTRRTA